MIARATALIVNASGGYMIDPRGGWDTETGACIVEPCLFRRRPRRWPAAVRKYPQEPQHRLRRRNSRP